MGHLRLVLRRASIDDFEAVRSLLMAASRWLRTKDTDQWAAPWPDRNERDERIMQAIEAGRTWIAWDHSRPAATLTASPNHHGIWPETEGRELAVYVRRITVRREYSGIGLGGQLLDWAGMRAARDYGARWVRVDVWTTNKRLHAYYEKRGFAYLGLSPVDGYPSAALFQKPVDEIEPLDASLFWEFPRTA